MSKEKILVVTATLGNRDTLNRTIESVRTIGGDMVRHVIIAPQDRINFIREKWNIECLAEPADRKGIYAALNYGFYTYGREYDYLTFINDDDYWLPDYRKVIEAIEKDPSLDMVYSKTLYINENNKVIGEQTSSGQFLNFRELFQSGIILLTQQSTLIRSNVFFRIGGFDETYKLVADTKFWMSLSLLKPKFRYLDIFSACYMMQKNQLSKDSETSSKEHQKLLEEFPITNIVLVKLYALKFRLLNLNVYIKRLFDGLTMRHPAY